MLVLSWGGTLRPGARRRAARARRRAARSRTRICAGSTRSRRTSATCCRSYDRVLVPEMNLGQLLQLVRAEYLVDAVGYNRVTGKPFKAGEIADAVEAMLVSDRARS